ncbi:hypothetical protein V2P39_03065 [Mycoplasma capricolum subsp. capricolum]|uniref:YobI family P-loop NTPase n=1 Tax=Mycoplasma capricolum TaxID=2095 RepID=UPI003DA3CC04
MTIITKYTRKYVLDIVKNGFLEKRFGIWKFHKYSYYGKLTYTDFLCRIYDFNSSNNKTKEKIKKIPLSTRTDLIFYNNLTRDSIFDDAIFKLTNFNSIYNKFNDSKNESNEVDPLLIFLCEMFHPEVRREKERWIYIFKKINDILSIDGIELFLNNEDNCDWRKCKKKFSLLKYLGIPYKFKKYIDYIFKRTPITPIFQNLTPNIKINDRIYDVALDDAFQKKEIRNIALTGSYSSGKTSTWLSYSRNRRLGKIITVSLGKYNNIKNTLDKNKKNYYNNRIERQIINQISSQIHPVKIPLSKYSFIKNKSWFWITLNTFLSCCFVFSIIGWLEKSFLVNKLLLNEGLLNWFLPISFFIPLVVWIFKFLKNNKFYISKIKFSKMEANLEEKYLPRATVFDRDIREIIYLLYSSNAKVVVFEDLDRFHNLEIFIKLKEINFILNSYIRRKILKRKPVKFIYMINDELFSPHIRTKFFDFIVPVLPVINSSNSESKFCEFLELIGELDSLDKNVIWKISLYISDIRLIKNIVNEFFIYNYAINSKNNQIDKNKLFALITLKNLMPKEFDLLQMDKGYIFNIFDKIKKYKINNIDSIKNELNEAKNKLSSLFENYAEFESNAALLKNDNILLFKDKYELMMSDNLIKTDFFIIKTIFHNNYTNVEKIKLNEFYYNNSLNINIKKIIVYNDPEIMKCYENIEFLEEQLNKKSIKIFLKSLTQEEINALFNNKNNKQINSRDISFLKFLFMEGLIDESYLNYMSYFYHGLLGKNDRIFIKNLLEHVNNNNFRIELENPKLLLDILDEEQLKSHLSFNIHLFKESINLGNNTATMYMFDSVWPSNKQLIAKSLSKFDFDTIYKFIRIFLEQENGIIKIRRFLDDSYDNLRVWEYLNSGNTIKDIIVSIKLKIVDSDFINYFSNFIFENIPDILNYNNQHYVRKIIGSLVSVDQDKKVEYINKNIDCYTLNVRNVMNIYEFIIGKSCYFNKLLTNVFKEEKMSKIKERIEQNFGKFVKRYIDLTQPNEYYENDESILISIINSSEIDDCYKKKYIELNKTDLLDLGKVHNLRKNREHIKHLFEKNKIAWSIKNFKKYIKEFNECDESFSKYFNNNINNSNYKDLLECEFEICNILLNNPYSNDKVFSFALKLANPNIKIKNLCENLEHSRILRIKEFFKIK